MTVADSTAAPASSVMRRALGVAAGVAVAVCSVILVEALGHLRYPPPPGLNPMNMRHAAQIVEAMSGGALSFVLAAWFIGAFVGGWVALRISHWRLAPWIISSFIVAGGISSFVMIPHPVWMMAAGVALPFLAALLISRRSRRGTDAV